MASDDDNNQFHRGAVEAAPDSLPAAVFSPSGAWDEDTASLAAPLTRAQPLDTGSSLPQFYRGNIEAGAETPGSGPAVTLYGGEAGAWQYYGAARTLNQQLRQAPEATGEVFHPTREAVEARPRPEQELSRRGHGRSLEAAAEARMPDRFMAEHGQRFRQSRPHGHSLAYDTYQGMICYESHLYIFLAFSVLFH